MKKFFRLTGISVFLLIGLASAAMAADAAAASPELIDFFKWMAIIAGFGMPLGVIGPAFAQGNGVKSACEGISRNPEASGKIVTSLVIGLAMIESLAIYALVIELILLYANPSLKYIIG